VITEERGRNTGAPHKVARYARHKVLSDHLPDPRHQHLEIIGGLRRGFFLLDVAESGIFYLFNRPSQAELNRFGST